MRGMFAGLIEGDAPLPDWISADEFDHYVTEFGRTGFTGALNWYRNYDRNWESTPQLTPAHRPPCPRCSSAVPPTRSGRR